jgi:hypothetical protein
MPATAFLFAIHKIPTNGYNYQPMIKNTPPRLFLILALLAMLVIWIPVLQQLLPGNSSAFSTGTWVTLSLLASAGILLLFFILYLVTRRK